MSDIMPFLPKPLVHGPVSFSRISTGVASFFF